MVGCPLRSDKSGATLIHSTLKNRIRFDMVFQKINQRDCKLLAGGIVLGIIFMGVVVGINYSLFQTHEIVLSKIETTVPTTTTTTTTTVTTSEEGKFALK